VGEEGYDIPHSVRVAAEDTCSRRPTEFSAPTRMNAIEFLAPTGSRDTGILRSRLISEDAVD
jgi:hypothetical protein